MDALSIIRGVALSTSVITVFALPPVAVALWPSADDSVVVIGDDVLATLAAAGGTLITASDDGRTAITRVDGGHDRDFVARLYRLGARAVLAAPSSAACTITPSRSFSSANDPRG